VFPTNACKAADCPGRILHDFRRTADRRFEQTGISRSVATKVTGHKTESVYRRYAIVSESDLRAACEALDGYPTVTTSAASGTNGKERA
jgi:hypothetical protein